MLNSFQKKICALAITCVSITVIAAFLFIFFRALGDFLNVFGAVVWPLATALILSFIFKPVVDLLAKKTHVNVEVACVAVFTFIVLAVGLLAFFVIPIMTEQLLQMCSAIPEAIQRLITHLSEKYPEIKDNLHTAFKKIQDFITSGFSPEAVVATVKKISSTAIFATGGIVSLVSFIAAFAVAPIYLFYMLTTNFDFYKKLDDNIAFVHSQWREDIQFFIHRFSDIMATFFRGQLLIAFIMGCLLGIGFSVAGIKFGFLLGFLAGILNIIPYFGTMIGLSTILPVAAFQDGGGVVLMAIAIAIFIAVQCIEGYLLTPKIMGDRTGLHPTVIIFSVFFWGIALNGILGMILAIPLTAFIVALWQRLLLRMMPIKSTTTINNDKILENQDV